MSIFNQLKINNDAKINFFTMEKAVSQNIPCWLDITQSFTNECTQANQTVLAIMKGILENEFELQRRSLKIAKFTSERI